MRQHSSRVTQNMTGGDDYRNLQVHISGDVYKGDTEWSHCDLDERLLRK